MNRWAYYEKLKELARQTRTRFGLTGPRVGRSDMRRIYTSEGIRLDLWPHRFRKLRGAYFDDDLGPTVVVARDLPDAPYIFTLAHELKHHLVDRGKGLSYCGEANESEPIEIGAEVFAAELIFPEKDFSSWLQQRGIAVCTPETLVQMKHETQTTLSYAGLAKRACWLNFAEPETLKGVQWMKLEERAYGVPFYRLRGRKSP